MADENTQTKYPPPDYSLYIGATKGSVYSRRAGGVRVNLRELLGTINRVYYPIPPRALTLRKTAIAIPDTRLITNVNLNSVLVDLLVGGTAGPANYQNITRMMHHLANGNASLNTSNSILPYQAGANPNPRMRWLAALLTVGISRVTNSPVGISDVMAFQTIISSQDDNGPRGIYQSFSRRIAANGIYTISQDDIISWARSIDFIRFMFMIQTNITVEDTINVIRTLHAVKYGDRFYRKAIVSGSHQNQVESSRYIPIGALPRTHIIGGIEYTLHTPQMDEVQACLSAMLVYITAIVIDTNIRVPQSNQERWDRAEEVFDELHFLMTIPPQVPNPLQTGTFGFLSTVINANITMRFSFDGGLPQGGTINTANSQYWQPSTSQDFSWIVVLPDANFPTNEVITYAPVPVSLYERNITWISQGEAIEVSVNHDLTNPNMPALLIRNATRNTDIVRINGSPNDNGIRIQYQYN